jgi:hypothetical protein
MYFSPSKVNQLPAQGRDHLKTLPVAELLCQSVGKIAAGRCYLSDCWSRVLSGSITIHFTS